MASSENCQKIITISENQKDTIVRKFGLKDKCVYQKVWGKHLLFQES
jgi:hypothetical protein